MHSSDFEIYHTVSIIYVEYDTECEYLIVQLRMQRPWKVQFLISSAFTIGLQILKCACSNEVRVRLEPRIEESRGEEVTILRAMVIRDSETKASEQLPWRGSHPARNARLIELPCRQRRL